MYKLLFVLTFFILSCSTSKQISENEDSKLIIELIEKFIAHDSLYNARTINEYLLPYEYYDQEFTEDGYLAPPPATINPNASKNEFDIANLFELTQFFNDSASMAHVKDQLLNSREIAKNYKLHRLDLVKSEINNKIPNSWYSFYPPIFNSDSSAVYMEYDFYTNGMGSVGYGNGAVLIKKKGLWEYNAFIPGWEN
ncbi:hypothetical protein [Algoriphagus yeomjeoni]|uniref:Uncharacterized protein n=1 Tax=Algoriphagus yeomjeoni TaxID=291403 RepID=A0A327P891_9BACT|nr:hypothetical protein [Algoriphagus yeomjeoni]RAI88438.1 hypothetical protein LV83_02738 [Algoriphagus yeomjeoni]